MVAIPPASLPPLLWKLIIQTIGVVVALGAALFLAGGTLAWPAAWVFLGETAACSLAVGLALARHDPRLLAERLSGPFQSAQVAGDRVFMVLAAIVWFAWLILIALDAARWQLSWMPVWLQCVGGAAIPVAMAFIWRVFVANPFAAPVIKLQPGQEVATGGPYGVVRHPMYAGGLLYIAGIPLLLGSWLGLLAVPIIAVLLSLRIRLEERALVAGLPGYAVYTGRVRWRLLPGLW